MQNDNEINAYLKIEYIMEKIEGLIDAPFTPFNEAGEVNYDMIAPYAAMLKKNGLKGVFINGSSSTKNRKLKIY